MSSSENVSAPVFDQVLYVVPTVCFFEKLFNKIRGESGLTFLISFFSSDTISVFLPQILVILVSK